MAHSYKTTHSHHDAMHGFSFSIEALTLAGIVGAFMLHWIIGVVSILPMVLLNGYLKSLLNGFATLEFLRKDCGVNVTWDEAYKLRDYFSPNETGHWIDARFLLAVPEDIRHQTLLVVIANFDRQHGKPDGSVAKASDSPNKRIGGDVE